MIAFLTLALALQDPATTVLAIAGLVGVGFVGWLRRSPGGAASLASLVATFVITSATTDWVGQRLDGVSSSQLGLVFWLFAAVILATTWLARRHRGSRVVTVVCGHAVLVVASIFAYVAPAAAPITGFAAAMGLIVWRSRGRRPPAEPPSRDAWVRGADRTRQVLTGDLGADWRLLEDRRLPDGRVVENLLIGPGGVFVVVSRSWSGRVELVRVDEVTAAYGLDGDVHELAARLRATGEVTTQMARALGLDPSDVCAVVVFWDATDLPDDVVELEIVGTEGGAGPRACLVRGEHLAEWLGRQPVTLRGRTLRGSMRQAEVALFRQ